MAGHSKWANIRHRKERQDKKKGQMWSKCSKAIMAAARQGGPDPDTNLSLRYAIDEAKYANMPKDTIQRAIDKGAGAGQGDNFENVTYEAYGPSGSAILVDALTDNNNRTVTDIRLIFKKAGLSLANSGSVAFMFKARGQMLIEAAKADEERLMEVALEAGAEDVEAPDGADGYWVIVTDPADFITVREAIEGAGLEIAEAEITKVADTSVTLAGDDSQKIMNLVDALEDNDDVQKLYTNADLDL